MQESNFFNKLQNFSFIAKVTRIESHGIYLDLINFKTKQLCYYKFTNDNISERFNIGHDVSGVFKRFTRVNKRLEFQELN